MSSSRNAADSQFVFAYPDGYLVPGMMEGEGFRLKGLLMVVSLIMMLIVVLNVGPWAPWSAPDSSAIVMSTPGDTAPAVCIVSGYDSLCR